METSVGIQWLLQPARYFSHAHSYFRGRSWFTSARQLIIALSSIDTRAPPRAICPRPVASLETGAGAFATGLRAVGAIAGVACSDQSSIVGISAFFCLLAGFAGWIVDGARKHRERYPLLGRGNHPRRRHGVELAVGALEGRLLDMRRRLRAEVVGGLEPPLPRQPIESVKLPSVRRRKIEVQRLRSGRSTSGGGRLLRPANAHRSRTRWHRALSDLQAHDQWAQVRHRSI